MIKQISIAAAIASAPLMLGQPAFAQEDDSAITPEMQQELDIFEKLMAAFETDDAEPIDKKQLKLARITTAAILPDGTYGRLMEKTFDQMLAPIAAIFSEITPQEVSLATGVSEAALRQLKIERVDEIGALLDPARAERGEKVFNLMIPLMKDAFTEIEPALREGMARAYARKFDARQLKELNAFFKTETGAFYASESFVLMAGPEVMSASMQAMPGIMQKVLAVIPNMADEMNAIAKAKTLPDLTEAELGTLAVLLEMPEEELKKNRDEMVAKAAAAEVEEAAEDAEEDAGEDAGEDRVEIEE